MRTLDDIREQLQAELPYLRERYDVDRLGICGSYVRGEQTDDSDLLVTFTETPGLFEVVNLNHYLEDTLGLSVDLGMPDALKEGPAADNIRRDAKRAMTGSAGQKRVPTGYIEEVPILLPPLPEQRRIVAKIEELEELPEGWTWTSLDQLLSNMRNGYSKAPRADDGVPILRISSVRPLSVNLDDVRYLEGKPDDYEKYLIEPGYLLFIRYNCNPELVGACGAVPVLDQPYAHPDKLTRGEVADHGTVMPSYLEIALNMGPSREHIQSRVWTTAGQAGISQGNLYSCPVPVPSPAERKQIVDEVERLLSVADDAAATAEREHTRAERLRQSILKQAFSGRPVSHDEDAAPAIEASSSDGCPSSASEETDSSSEEDEVIAEGLYNGGDPGKQIEMDL